MRIVASEFADVDRSADPNRLVSFLDHMVVTAPTKSRLIELLGIRAGQRILDLGCGAGHDLIAIAEAGGRPIGVDPSRRMLEVSARRCPTAWVVQADGTALPIADAAPDGCRVERVLVHLSDPAAALAEVGRVLRPDARVVLFEPSPATLTGRAPPRGRRPHWPVAFEIAIGSRRPGNALGNGCARPGSAP